MIELKKLTDHDKHFAAKGFDRGRLCRKAVDVSAGGHPNLGLFVPLSPNDNCVVLHPRAAPVGKPLTRNAIYVWTHTACAHVDPKLPVIKLPGIHSEYYAAHVAQSSE